MVLAPDAAKKVLGCSLFQVVRDGFIYLVNSITAKLISCFGWVLTISEQDKKLHYRLVRNADKFKAG